MYDSGTPNYQSTQGRNPTNHNPGVGQAMAPVPTHLTSLPAGPHQTPGWETPPHLHTHESEVTHRNGEATPEGPHT